MNELDDYLMGVSSRSYTQNDSEKNSDVYWRKRCVDAESDAARLREALEKIENIFCMGIHDEKKWELVGAIVREALEDTSDKTK
jgi:hypothetical protein